MDPSWKCFRQKRSVIAVGTFFFAGTFLVVLHYSNGRQSQKKTREKRGHPVIRSDIQAQYGDCAITSQQPHPIKHFHEGPALMEPAAGQDLRIFLLEHSCWTRNYNMNYWLIIRLPILIAIGVNFVIFIRVICIIISKLQANLMCRTDTKCRLAKSTLTLIPLLGTHEIIFAFITDEHAKGSLRYIKLFFELSFSSFQGLMVAVLYCFINNEVQAEFQRRWERWRLEHLYSQRDSIMKPIKFPANSLSSGVTMGSSV